MTQDTTSFGFSTPATQTGRCQHCGGSDLIGGLEVNQSVEVGSTGLRYKTAKIFVTVEPLKAELCRNCGTVVRFYVKETNRNWIQKA